MVETKGTHSALDKNEVNESSHDGLEHIQGCSKLPLLKYGHCRSGCHVWYDQMRQMAAGRPQDAFDAHAEGGDADDEMLPGASVSGSRGVPCHRVKRWLQAQLCFFVCVFLLLQQDFFFNVFFLLQQESVTRFQTLRTCRISHRNRHAIWAFITMGKSQDDDISPRASLVDCFPSLGCDNCQSSECNTLLQDHLVIGVQPLSLV